jgi:Xaa-Pro dipeptidase
MVCDEYLELAMPFAASPVLATLYAEHLQTLQQRASLALQNAHCDRLIIAAGRPHGIFLDDQDYPFKINPHFKQWIPLLDAPYSWLIIESGIKPTLVFVQPSDYWHQPPQTPSGYWTEHIDIRIVRDAAEAIAMLPSTGRSAFVGESHNDYATLNFVMSQSLLAELHYQRAYKTSYEIECMRMANVQGVAGHRAVEVAFRGGASEYELHLTYLEHSEQTEEELPYHNIIAANRNGSVLHYQHLSRTRPAVGDRHSLLIDAGGQFQGYASDITRTYAYRDDEFSQLIEALDSAQQRLGLRVRAGIDFVDLHLQAHREIASLLRDADLISLDPETAVESGLSSVFLPHGLGHLLGLQVHDVCGHVVDIAGAVRNPPTEHPYLRLTRRLEPGVVVTIEPGLYFIDQLLEQARAGEHRKHIHWSRVDQLRRYGGIRIEDNVCCTIDAPDNLTRRAFAA